MPSEETQKFFVNFFASGISAAVAKTIVAPLDRIKLIMQNQDSALQVLTGGRQKYKGVFNILLRLPKEQGYLSYWRGNGTNLIRYFPTQALNFSCKDLYQKNLENVLPFIQWKDSASSYISGSLAGMTSTSIVYPLEFCQTKLSVDVGEKTGNPNKKREFNGLRDCLSKVYEKEGMLGFYRGFVITVMGVGVYRGWYFGLYDDLKRRMNLYYLNRPPLHMIFLIAQIASMISGIASYPLDTVGRRLMLDSGRPEHLRQHKNFLSCVLHIYKNDCIHGFFRGVVPNIFRSLGGALVLVFYEEILYVLNWAETDGKGKKR